MRVTHLSLEDFRNYDRAEVAFEPGLNLVVGPNAQGKTNLLEAIYVLTGFPSPRGPDSVVVRSGAERAVVHGSVLRAGRDTRVDVELRPGRGRRARVNRSALPTGRSLAELVTAVYFGPDELALVKGAPEGRRRFLDDLVVKLRPARDGLRKEWERVLRQRNAALRAARTRYGGRPDDTLAVWTESFCRTGAALTSARLEVLDALQPLVAERYGSIAGSGEVQIAYASSWLHEPEGDPGALARRLTAATAEVATQEIERGQSLIGPQRDDLSVVIRTPDRRIEARTHASQGDQRTCALALKLAEHDVLTAALGEQPILLLDDVFSELDPTRRAWLAKNVAELDQALVTTTAAEDLDLAGVDVIFEIAGGTVEMRARHTPDGAATEVRGKGVPR